jgi:hypothetical protein
MSKNFEKFNNGEGENEKEYTKEEFEEAFYDLFLDANMRIFGELMQKNPKFAESIKPAYEEFINEMNGYFVKNKTIKGFLEYMEKSKPNNFWIDAMAGAVLAFETEKNKSEGPQEDYGEIEKDDYIKSIIKEFIKRKRRGKDIQ